jgi:hypothetical protein
MALPNSDKAYIPSQKLKGYLLSEAHGVGRSKAKFFRSLGFDESNVALFEQNLLEIARTGTMVEIVTTQHGKKYVVDGTLEAPGGRTVTIRTIWIIEVDTDEPRFVTAYPSG